MEYLFIPVNYHICWKLLIMVLSFIMMLIIIQPNICQTIFDWTSFNSICARVRFLIEFFSFTIFEKIITVPFYYPIKKSLAPFLDVFFNVILQTSLPQKPQMFIPHSSSLSI